MATCNAGRKAPNGVISRDRVCNISDCSHVNARVKCKEGDVGDHNHSAHMGGAESIILK